MSWEMQVKFEVPLGSGNFEWKSLQASHLDVPYRYATKDDAVKMLRICYPDLVRDERLAGRDPADGEMTRVVEVQEPANI